MTRGGSCISNDELCRVSFRQEESQLEGSYINGFRLALDLDDSPKFRLAETVVTIEVGESKTVNILNGNGSYTVEGGTANFTSSVSGSRLTVTGTTLGTNTVIVTNTSTGAQAVLTVIVTEAVEEEHEYVDLGLPSGTLWATCNVGANAPEEYGDYFAWGETEPKTTYTWANYKWCNGSNTTMTKYCTNSSYGTVDNKTELEVADDAATANWGSSWRMPSLTQIKELVNESTSVWTTQNGVNGYLVTGFNGNTLFLPAAGIRYGSSLDLDGMFGNCWSRTLYSTYPCNASNLCYYSSYLGYNLNNYRYYGFTVRAVRVQ